MQAPPTPSYQHVDAGADATTNATADAGRHRHRHCQRQRQRRRRSPPPTPTRSTQPPRPGPLGVVNKIVPLGFRIALCKWNLWQGGRVGAGTWSPLPAAVPPHTLTTAQTDLLFGISSVAGVAIAVSQGNAGDIPVNAAGVVVVGALAFFDLGATGSQVDQAKEMMANDSLGKVRGVVLAALLAAAAATAAAAAAAAGTTTNPGESAKFQAGFPRRAIVHVDEKSICTHAHRPPHPTPPYPTSFCKDLWSEDPQAPSDGEADGEAGAAPPAPGKVMSAADLGISSGEGTEES